MLAAPIALADQEVFDTSRLKEVELLVFEVLRDSERARNNDTVLILKVAERLGHKVVVEKDYSRPQSFRAFTPVVVWHLDIYNMVSFESITRARRKIQAGGQYLPTDPKVCRQRRINQERMRLHYGVESHG